MGLGLLSLFPILKFSFFKKKPMAISCAPEMKTIKMLTEDGRLVEVDATHLHTNKQKISNKELMAWVKK